MIDRVVTVLVSASLIAMMLSVGLAVAFPELAAIAKDWRLVARAFLGNYVFVPGMTVLLLFLLHTKPMVGVAFLILSVCPGAPFGPPLTAMAKGNVVASVGLMVILAGSSTIFAPLLLGVLLGFVTGDASLHVNAQKIVGTLLITQLVPLSAGLAIRHWRPDLAARLNKPFRFIASLLVLITLAVVLVVQYQMLVTIRFVGFVAMLVLSLASLAIGWFTGGPDSSNRKAMALTTSFRNAGVGMVIASGSFADTPVLPAVVAYTLVSTLGTVVPALWWGKHPSTNREVAEDF
jgi:BASS family bile acid:Na+ symporter